MSLEEAQDGWGGRPCDAERSCTVSLRLYENLAAGLSIDMVTCHARWYTRRAKDNMLLRRPV